MIAPHPKNKVRINSVIHKEVLEQGLAQSLLVIAIIIIMTLLSTCGPLF